MNATLSRSDVLRVLIWPAGMLLLTLMALIYFNAPEWVLITISILMASCFLIYFVAFIFCLIFDRDALRSEKYSLNKMAIERGVYGDSESGFVDNDVADAGIVIPSTKSLANNSEAQSD